MSNDPPQEYSTEYLQYVEQLNRTTVGKKVLEAQHAHMVRMQELEIKYKELELKALDTTLTTQREVMRPHRLQQTFVAYDAAEGRYRCQMADYSDPEEEIVDERPIVAYGDTPAQACDNFDHLWIHGDKSV